MVAGDVVHVHVGKYAGWSGYVHAVRLQRSHVSQRDRLCHASRFWILSKCVVPGIQTFDGYRCLRCHEVIR